MTFKKIALFFICLYRRFISPILPPACRFEPTCSQYAYDAISTYGLRMGIWLALKRLLRCQPFALGGYDPVIKTEHAVDSRQ